MSLSTKLINGPIPGENFTSDTKNYAWHRPPDITDLDKAIELANKQLTDEDSTPGLISMLHMGVDIATLTDIFVTQGVGAGKWTIDMALLLCGPVSNIIYLLAKGYGIKNPNLGLKKKGIAVTKSYIDSVMVDAKTMDTVKKTLNNPQVMMEAQKQINAMTPTGVTPPLVPTTQPFMGKNPLPPQGSAPQGPQGLGAPTAPPDPSAGAQPPEQGTM